MLQFPISGLCQHAGTHHQHEPEDPPLCPILHTPSPSQVGKTSGALQSQERVRATLLQAAGPRQLLAPSRAACLLPGPACLPCSEQHQHPPLPNPAGSPIFPTKAGFLFIFFYKQRVTKGQRIKFERGSCSSTNTQQTQAPIVHTSISSHELLNSLPGW